jgi:methylenetetrahydrofolate dehydrogenase (NADP+)/methenyltetrahydrofolate cyclohydrolase
MSAKIIDGKALSQKIKVQIKEEIAAFSSNQPVPGLAVVIVGNDPASRVYVNSKKNACAETGIYSEEHALPEETSEDELLTLIDKLNNDSKISGILVQLPLPPHINTQKVINAISPEKDVDGFHPVSTGRLMTGQQGFVPCTPAGVIEMIKETGVEIQGKDCVVVGRSNIVGKPLALLLLAENGTVTICHSKTKNLPEICRRADILVAAVGKAKMITGDMIKPGAVVIDVGMNRLADKKLCGDVAFDTAVNIAEYITPVPGGVGPMTIAMLMKNTLYACKRQNGLL